MGVDFIHALEAWTRRAAHVFIWHYSVNFGHYLAPNPNLAALAQDLRMYREYGVHGVMTQCAFQSPGGELSELRQYLASQLLWEPTCDPMSIRQTFCSGYYGAAAVDVLDYLDLMDRQAVESDAHAFVFWDPQQTVSPAFLNEASLILERAVRRADSDTHAQRLERLLLPLAYMRHMNPARYGLSRADARSSLAWSRGVIEQNAITHVREDHQPNAQAWLSLMETIMEPVPGDMVCDLLVEADQADRSACAAWYPNTFCQSGETYHALFHLAPDPCRPASAHYTASLPELHTGERLELAFGTAFSGPVKDGSRFVLAINGADIWSYSQTREAPEFHVVDLSGWAARDVRLSLRIEPLAAFAPDWSNWVHPRITRVSDGVPGAGRERNGS